MAQKRYRLTAVAKTTPYFIANTWAFRTGFDVYQDGKRHICPTAACPRLAIDGSAVVGTDNMTVQFAMDHMQIPKGPTINGLPYAASGAVFEDITATSVPGDVTYDVDSLLPTVI